MRCLVGGVVFLCVFGGLTGESASGQVNDWTKATSGSWEEPYWSLGVLPARGEGLIAFRNPGWKALAITSATTANYPGSLSMDSVLIEGPTNSQNQLLLNYPGQEVPLTVDGSLTLGTNASMQAYYSTLHTGNFYLSSPAGFFVSTVAVSSNLVLGLVAPAQLGLTNSSCTAPFVKLSTGSELVLESGYVGLGQVNFAGGAYRQDGGTAVVTNMGHQYPLGGGNAVYLSSGTLLSGTVNVGNYDLSGIATETFTQSGGVHSNANLYVNGGQRHYREISHAGTYVLNSGVLSSTNISVMAGIFTQTGGTNYAGQLGVIAGAYYTLAGGQLVTSNANVSTVDCLRDTFVQTGGVHVVQSSLQLGKGARYTVANASLSAPLISIDGQSELSVQPGAVVSNPGVVALALGGLRVDIPSQQFGKLQVLDSSSPNQLSCQDPTAASAATLYAGSSSAQAVTMRFADSRDVAWTGPLKIVNWSASNAGAGADHIYFGNSAQALTPDQVARILFVRPDNSTNDFGATIRADGEIVPAMPQNFTVTVTNGSVTITRYTGSGGAVVIPSSINGMPVVEIGNGAFNGQSDVTSVTIPDTVTAIGANAFSYCYGLPTLTIPDSVKTIGDQAFYVCQGLTNIFFGKGIAFVGFAALRYCPNLVGVYFAGDAPVFDPNFDFYNSPQVVVYHLPGTAGWDATLAGQPTALWVQPQPIIVNFGTNFGFKNGRFGFVVSWATNASVVIEGRSALGGGTWTPLSTNSSEPGWFYFSDAQAAALPMRFYRAREE